MTEFGMVLPFLTDDPKWIRGFECGVLYEQMKQREPISVTLHSLSEDQLRVMAGHLKWSCEVVRFDETWIHVSLVPHG